MTTESTKQEEKQDEKERGKELVPIDEVAIVRLVQDFPPAILKSIVGLVEYHTGLIEQTRAELHQVGEDLETTTKCLSAAEELDIHELVTRHKRTITSIKKEQDFLQRRLEVLEEGFLPFPRFDYASIEWSGEMMNYRTLKRLKEAKDKGLFDRFGVVQDKYTRPRQRDPMLVGILTAGRMRGSNSYEEHFFIGVWH